MAAGNCPLPAPGARIETYHGLQGTVLELIDEDRFVFEDTKGCKWTTDRFRSWEIATFRADTIELLPEG